MLPWVWPVVAGAVGALGSIFTNRSNAKQASKQMEFQERMSSSAAQRSVADYRAAGLNPALAYDRPASSPPGAMSGQSDVIGAGISNARGVALQKQQMELAQRQQSNLDAETRSRLALNNADFDVKTQTANVLEQQRMAAIRDNTIGAAVLPHTMQQRISEAMTAAAVGDLRRADATIRQNEIPASANAAAFARKMGIWQQAIPFATGSASSASSVFSNLLRSRFR